MIRKIRDIPAPCNHPEHNPPTHMVLSPGVYENVCPGCGRVTVFTVQNVTWSSRNKFIVQSSSSNTTAATLEPETRRRLRCTAP